MNTIPAPQNPGSYNEFVARNEIEDPQEAARLHGEAVGRYATELATYHGVDREDLHQMKFPRSESKN